MAHPKMEEAYLMAEEAAKSTRGLYPVTKSTSVVMKNGETLEKADEAADGEDSSDSSQESDQESLG